MVSSSGQSRAEDPVTLKQNSEFYGTEIFAIWKSTVGLLHSPSRLPVPNQGKSSDNDQHVI